MNVTHFDPYFYVPCPRGFASDDLEPFKNHLNVGISDRLHIPTLKYLQEVSGGDYVVRTELVKKQSLWGYKGDTPVNFIRIVTIDARNLPKVRDKYIPCLSSNSILSSHTRLRKSSMYLPRIVRRRYSHFRKQHRIHLTVHD